MYLIFVAFRNYGDKNTKTFPIIVHFVQKKCEKRAKRHPNRRMSERRAKLAWTIPSEKEEDEIKRAQSDARIGFALQHILHRPLLFFIRKRTFYGKTSYLCTRN